MSDAWEPGQYARFRAEREQPFFDLLRARAAAPGRTRIDLGCGTGALTRILHERTGASETAGVDRSEAMLAGSERHAGGSVRFERSAIEAFTGEGLDLVFSNAALQWVADHEALFARLAGMLAAGGQLAVQMPATMSTRRTRSRTRSRGRHGTRGRSAATCARTLCVSQSGTRRRWRAGGSRNSTYACRSTSIV